MEKNSLTSYQHTEKSVVVYKSNDGTIQLEVQLANDTVWLTQAQMAMLFGTQRQAVTKHLKNIFECHELEKTATSSILEQVQKEGNRMVNRKIELYNLDVIISVGYRVNTSRGIEFRQWANTVLKRFLIKGYIVNKRFTELEQTVARQGNQINELQSKVDFFVRSSLPPVEGIFYDGQLFDAYAQIVSMIKQAKRSIVLIDNYVDETTLTMLSKRGANVSATIYTKQTAQQFQLDVQRHNQQYPPITIHACQHNHDRFLIIDDVVYLFGASLKDAGKKLFAYIQMQETSAADVLNWIR